MSSTLSTSSRNFDPLCSLVVNGELSKVSVLLNDEGRDMIKEVKPFGCPGVEHGVAGVELGRT